MKELVFATNNKNKLHEIEALLKGLPFKILSLDDIKCNEDIPEPFDTLEENALAKAKFVNNKFGLDCFADDTGLEVDSLEGRPGVYSARYAGEPSDSFKNMDKVLQELKNARDRKAKFRTVLALVFDNKTHFFEGEVKGEIAKSKSGTKGFGYDPIFYPENKIVTFAEMALSEKNQISHRARAISKLVGFLKNKTL